MKNRWIIILGIILIVFISFELVSVSVMTSDKSIDVKEDLIMVQAEKEKDLNALGYTIDKPNVVLNPYGNSPLTALVMFETDEEVSPVVTIKGKDKLST